jgi:hypothetical protein
MELILGLLILWWVLPLFVGVFVIALFVGVFVIALFVTIVLAPLWIPLYMLFSWLNSRRFGRELAAGTVAGACRPRLLQASEQSRQNADSRPRFSRSASHMPAQPRCRR